MFAGRALAAHAFEGGQRLPQRLGVALDARGAHAPRRGRIERAGESQPWRHAAAGHEFRQQFEAVAHRRLGPRQPRHGSGERRRPRAARAGNLGGQAGQFGSDACLEPHGFQPRQPAERAFAVGPLGEPRLDIDAEGAVARLRPEHRHHRLVEPAVGVRAGMDGKQFRQKDAFGIGPGSVSGAHRQRPSGETLDETGESHLDFAQSRYRRAGALGAKALEVAQLVHRRPQAKTVVGIETREHPGVEALVVQQGKGFRRQRGQQITDLGVGLGGDAGPVQHLFLPRTRQGFERGCEPLDRAVRGRGEQDGVEPFLQFVLEKPSRRRLGRGHRASPSCPDRRSARARRRRWPLRPASGRR